MTVYCHGDCHVWLGSSSLCTCEVERAARYVTITQLDTNIPQGEAKRSDKYISFHPELPTVISQADTPEEARANLIEATEMAVRHLAENGLPVPQPLAFPLAIDLALMYGFPANYNPFGPYAPQPTPTAPDVPLQQFHAAQQAGATHLSGDGKTAYMTRMGRVCWADWSHEAGAFGMWWESQADEMPADAVVLK